MPIEIVESIKRRQRVRFLSGLTVEHVSMVSKGANWTPFTPIIKEQSGMAGQVIQAIVLPKGVTLEDFVADPTYMWLATAKSDLTHEFDSCVSYEQVAKETFVPESITSVILKSSGASLVCGRLRDVEKADGMLVLPPEFENQEEPTNTPRYAIARELDAFTGVLWSALSQTTPNAAKRKTVIMQSLGAFWDFLDTALDTFGPGAIKAEDMSGTDGGLVALVKGILKTESPNNSHMDAELLRATDALKNDIQALQKQSKMLDESGGVNLYAEMSNVTNALKGDIQTLRDQHQEVLDKIAVLEHAVTTVPPEPDISYRKSDKGGKGLWGNVFG